MKTVDERFDEKWEPVPWSGCFVWTGASFAGGRACFKQNGKVMGAYRYAFERENGLIPDGLHVLHRCDNPFCVNPRHLFLGTQADNNRDCMQKKRNARGLRCGAAKLSDEQIAAILIDDRPQNEIAAEYGVGQPYVSKLKTRREVRADVQGAPIINIRRNVKLTFEQIRSIKTDMRSQRTIAAEYKVDQSVISRIKTGSRPRNGARTV